MTICKGKRYIKPTCDKCVELPYCKPTEKTKFKKAQQVYNKFLFDSHLKTLREVELQEKRLAAVEQGNTEQPRATHNARLEKLENLVGTLQRHGEEICRLESQVVVLESNARVATECSNKQAHAIEALQTEIHFIKERLGRCQDSVAELDPLGCVTVRKRGRPPKTKL